MADGEQLTYTIVVNKETGQLSVLASEFGAVQAATQGASEKSEEFGNRGGDALSKIESRASRMAINLLVVQVIFAELSKLVKESTSFQELQGTFEKMAEGLGSDLGPALGTISTGLQGVIIMAGGLLSILKPLLNLIIDDLKAGLDMVTGVVGAAINASSGNLRGAWASLKGGMADAKGEFKGLGDQFSASFSKMGQAAQDAMDRINGVTKQQTANSVEALSAEMARREAHLTAETALQNAVDNERAAKLHATEETKIDVIVATNRREIQLLSEVGAMKARVIDAQFAAGKLTKQKHDEEILALQQSTADKEMAIIQKAAAEDAKVEEEKTKKLEALFLKQIEGTASAAAKRYETTHNLADATRAAGGEEVRLLAQEAGHYIALQGAKAAANSYVAASLLGGPVAGAAAAAATMLFFVGLAAAVEVAGSELSGVVDPGGGSSAPGSAGSSSGPATATGASGGGVISSAAPSAGAGSSNLPPINVYVDGQVLFNLISNATRDGKLLIYASAVH